METRAKYIRRDALQGSRENGVKSPTIHMRDEVPGYIIYARNDNAVSNRNRQKSEIYPQLFITTKL